MTPWDDFKITEERVKVDKGMKVKQGSIERGSKLLQWKWNSADELVQRCNTPTCSLSTRREMDGHISKTCVWHTQRRVFWWVTDWHSVQASIEKSPSKGANAVEPTVHTTQTSRQENVRKFSFESFESVNTPSVLTSHTHTHPLWSCAVCLCDVLLSFYRDESCCWSRCRLNPRRP